MPLGLGRPVFWRSRGCWQQGSSARRAQACLSCSGRWAWLILMSPSAPLAHFRGYSAQPPTYTLQHSEAWEELLPTHEDAYHHGTPPGYVLWCSIFSKVLFAVFQVSNNTMTLEELKSSAPGFEHDPEAGDRRRTVMMVQMDEAPGESAWLLQLSHHHSTRGYACGSCGRLCMLV